MAEETRTQASQSILTQIEGELKKSELEGHKAKIKEMLKRRRDAQKVVDGIDTEIQKYLEDNGLS